MSDLVGNPEDRFSCGTAHIAKIANLGAKTYTEISITVKHINCSTV